MSTRAHLLLPIQHVKPSQTRLLAQFRSLGTSLAPPHTSIAFHAHWLEQRPRSATPLHTLPPFSPLPHQDVYYLPRTPFDIRRRPQLCAIAPPQTLKTLLGALFLHLEKWEKRHESHERLRHGYERQVTGPFSSLPLAVRPRSQPYPKGSVPPPSLPRTTTNPEFQNHCDGVSGVGKGSGVTCNTAPPRRFRKAVSLKGLHYLPRASPCSNPDPDLFVQISGARRIVDQLLGSEVPEVGKCGCHVRRLCICVRGTLEGKGGVGRVS